MAAGLLRAAPRLADAMRPSGCHQGKSGPCCSRATTCPQLSGCAGGVSGTAGGPGPWTWHPDPGRGGPSCGSWIAQDSTPRSALSPKPGGVSSLGLRSCEGKTSCAETVGAFSAKGVQPPAFHPVSTSVPAEVPRPGWGQGAAQWDLDTFPAAGPESLLIQDPALVDPRALPISRRLGGRWPGSRAHPSHPWEGWQPAHRSCCVGREPRAGGPQGRLGTSDLQEGLVWLGAGASLERPEAKATHWQLPDRPGPTGQAAQELPPARSGRWLSQLDCLMEWGAQKVLLGGEARALVSRRRQRAQEGGRVNSLALLCCPHPRKEPGWAGGRGAGGPTFGHMRGRPDMQSFPGAWRSGRALD